MEVFFELIFLYTVVVQQQIRKTEQMKKQNKK